MHEVVKKRVLLIGDGPEEGKRPLVNELLARSDFDITHLSNNTASRVENGWMQQLAFPDARTIHADLRDHKGTIERVRQWLERQPSSPLRGVLTYAEECTPVTNAIARGFQLPEISTGDISAVRDKQIMRQTFRDAKLQQPLSIRCRSLAEVQEAIAKTGLPCVLKPVDLASSLGVTKITEDNIHDLESIYRDAVTVDAEDNIRKNYALSTDVLVEEYIRAEREISVEAAVVNGRLRIIGPTQKHLGPEPHFEEIGHTTDAQLSSRDAINVGVCLERAVQALKLDWTAIHAELRFPGGDAEPVLVEVGARLGGDLIHFLWKWARGYEFPSAILDLAVGEDPKLQPTKDGYASIWYIKGKRAFENVQRIAVDLETEPTIESCTVVSYPMFNDGNIERPNPSGEAGVCGHVVVVSKTINGILEANARLGNTSQGL